MPSPSELRARLKEAKAKCRASIAFGMVDEMAARELEQVAEEALQWTSAPPEWWISVKEALPPNSDAVLIIYSLGVVAHAMRLGHYQGGGWSLIDPPHRKVQVFYWMPCPEWPPLEEVSG